MLSVEATLSRIRRNPKQFPIVDGNTRRALLKRFPYGVFYEIEESTIILTAVFHAKRNPRDRQDR